MTSSSLLMHLKLHEAHQKYNQNHIHYTVHGPEQMTDTTVTYVLIHGNRSSSLYWELFQQQIHALRDVRTVAVDLRGYGKSNHIQDVKSFDEFADDVHKIILEIASKDEQSIEYIHSRYILVGWSLGAIVALTLAAKHQKYYHRLVLVAPAPISGYPYMQVDQNGLLTDQQCTTREQVENLPLIMEAFTHIQQKDLTSFRSRCYSHWFNVGPKPSEEYVELLLKECLLQSNFLDVAWLLHSYNVTQMVKENVVASVLIIHGKQDLVVPSEKSQEIFDTLGGDKCKLVILDNVAHMLPLSIPQELAKQILEFTDQQ